MLRRAGFTLIELLVVCSILAALAYAGVGAYAGVDRRAEDELARVALMRLASALRRFHDDTGYWPGEGPFCVEGNGEGSCKGAIPLANIPVGSDKAAWLMSPANFWLLFERPPLAGPLAFLGNWDAAAHRGWNGPYLPLADRHWVDVWQGLQNGAAPGGGVIEDVPTFAAGSAFSPVGAGSGGSCTGGSSCYLGARSLPRSATGYVPARHAFVRHARPFVFLPSPRARVVYWGPDGRYGGTNANDACLPTAASDDVVICL